MEQITIKEIAKICKVGVSTVSRAINNHPDINPDTKKLIMDTIREYNYVPNNSARNLKRVESNTIAILAKGIENPLFGRMIHIIEQEVMERNYLCVLQQVEEQENEIEVALRIEKEKRLKGIVFMGGASHPKADLLRQLTVPYIIMTVNAVMDEGLDQYGIVAVDDEKESYRIVDYLCSCGHKRIALLTAYAHDTSIGKLRLNGYERALRDHGIFYDEQLVVPMDVREKVYTMKNGYMQTQKLLESGVPFTAIYAISDTLAVGACKAVFDAGLNVPGDISVVGFDGLDLAKYYQPSITTIEQPAGEMAVEGTKMLFELIRDKAGHKQHIFEASLLKGQSVRTL